MIIKRKLRFLLLFTWLKLEIRCLGNFTRIYIYIYIFRIHQSQSYFKFVWRERFIYYVHWARFV